MSTTLRAYSLGYEGTSLDSYIEVLKSHKISVVVDVRETPWSYKPGFSKKPLSERLIAEDIKYVHVKSAGNPSRNRKMGLPQQEVIGLYREHLERNPGCLAEILTLMKSGSAICLLCFEREAHDCHRKVILDKLAELNGELVNSHLHIPPSTSEKKMGLGRIPKPNNRKRAGVHMEITQDERGLVAV